MLRRAGRGVSKGEFSDEKGRKIYGANIDDDDKKRANECCARSRCSLKLCLTVIVACMLGGAALVALNVRLTEYSAPKFNLAYLSDVKGLSQNPTHGELLGDAVRDNDEIRRSEVTSRRAEAEQLRDERHRLELERERIALEMERSKIEQLRAEANAVREATRLANERTNHLRNVHVEDEPAESSGGNRVPPAPPSSDMPSHEVAASKSEALQRFERSASMREWGFDSPEPSLWLHGDAGVRVSSKNEVLAWDDSSGKGRHTFTRLEDDSMINAAKKQYHTRPGMHHLRHSSFHVQQEEKRREKLNSDQHPSPTFVEASDVPAHVSFSCSLHCPTFRLTDRSTLFVVIRPNADSMSGSERRAFFGSHPDGQLKFDPNGFPAFESSAKTVAVRNAASVADRWMLLTYRFDRFVEISANGETATRVKDDRGMPARARFSNTAGEGGMHGVTLGGVRGGCEFHGSIGEVLYFPSLLNDEDARCVSEYLGRRWNLDFASSTAVDDIQQQANAEDEKANGDDLDIAAQKLAVREREARRIERVSREREQSRENADIRHIEHEEARRQHMSVEQFRAARASGSLRRDGGSDDDDDDVTEVDEHAIFAWSPSDDARPALVTAWRAAQENSRMAIENGSSDYATETDALQHIRKSLFGDVTGDEGAARADERQGRTRAVRANSRSSSSSTGRGKTSSPIVRNIMAMPAPPDAKLSKREEWESRLRQVQKEVREMKIGGPKLREWLKDQKRQLISLRSRLFGDV